CVGAGGREARGGGGRQQHGDPSISRLHQIPSPAPSLERSVSRTQRKGKAEPAGQNVLCGDQRRRARGGAAEGPAPTVIPAGARRAESRNRSWTQAYSAIPDKPLTRLSGMTLKIGGEPLPYPAR